MMLALLVRHFGDLFIFRSSCCVGDSQRVAAAAWCWKNGMRTRFQHDGATVIVEGAFV